jgi:hypothetical protein
MKIKKNFLRGRMNKDVDERLVPSGEYRDAQNVIISDTEGSDTGAGQNTLGNIQLTDIPLGANPVHLGETFDSSKKIVVWFVQTDTEDIILSYNIKTGITNVILRDTRGVNSVLSFDPNYKIQATIIVDSDNDRTILIWTDGKTEPKLVNINDAITWSDNGFSLEDITLLRPAPLNAPTLNLKSTSTTNENVLRERMVQFAYQWRYSDQQYSALSPFSEVAFEPSTFSYDYTTTTNNAMVNKFNAVDVNVATGSDKVEAIRIVFKEPGSSALFIVEELEKDVESIPDSSTTSLTVENDKYYTASALRTVEIDRLYDAVPRSAFRLVDIGNRIGFGNYTEGYDMVDENGNKIKTDFTVSLNSEQIPDDEPRKSMKSNRSYELAIGYLDQLGRMPTVFTSRDNTVFISNSLANHQNKLQLQINSKAPEWATHYRIFIKEGRGDYDSISPLIFYQDGQFLWIKLEGDDVNKVSKGDFLYAKTSSSGLLSMATQVEVLDVKTQETNFLESDDSITTIEQQPGAYMKIKPSGFSLSPGDVSIFNSSAKGYRSRDIDNNITSNDNVIEGPVYYGIGDGLDDLTSGGTYSGTTDIRYLIRIDTVGATDTFSYSANDGVSWTSIGNITGGAQALNNGVTVTFGAVTGHSVNDTWTISAKADDVVDDGNEDGRAWVPLQSKPADDEGIRQGAVITISYKEVRSGTIVDYAESFTSSRFYENIEEWFYGEDIVDKITWPDTLDRVIFRRGTPIIKNGETESVDMDPTGDLFMIFQSKVSRDGGIPVVVEASMEILELETSIIFETIPPYTDTGLFYEWYETFEIQAGGLHDYQGGLYTPGSTQTEDSPAVVEINAFNCFAWFNGYESYKIKDKLAGRPLKLDSRAQITIPNFRKNIRQADITWSGVYEQSTNLNRINEFNLATFNFKQMDDRYGPISNLMSRDTDIICWQEDKVHIIPFEKDILFTASGDSSITESNKVLGKERAVTGEYGLLVTDFRAIGESGNRIWWPDAKRGVVCRLGGDGISEVSGRGMRTWFRDRFRENLEGERIATHDPYYDLYTLTMKEDGVVQTFAFECGYSFQRYNQTGDFVYTLSAKQFTESFDLSYNVTSGSITISADFDGTITNSGTLIGSGTFSISRSDLGVDLVTITVTGTGADYSIENICTEGEVVEIITMIVTGSENIGESLGLSHSWSIPGFSSGENIIRSNLVPTSDGVQVYKKFIGLKSSDEFPNGNGGLESTVRLALLDGPETWQSEAWYYLVTNTTYGSSDFQTIIDSGTSFGALVAVDNFGSFDTYKEFAYNDASGDKIYLIMDWRNESLQVIANDDTAVVTEGSEVDIPVLTNDAYVGTPVVSITSGPTNGTASVRVGNIIRYRNDGTTGADSITYQLGTVEGSSTDTATVAITVDPFVSGGGGGSNDGIAFSMTTAGYLGASPSDGSVACNILLQTTRYHNGLNAAPTLDDFIYTDAAKTTPFNGQNKYYGIPNGRTVKVATTGRVIDLWICGQDVGGGGGGNA